MKTYTFPWHCEAASGELQLDISPKEIELIKAAYRDAFDRLEDSDSLVKIRRRALKQLPFYERGAKQDIRIYFPEEIKKEVDKEDE